MKRVLSLLLAGMLSIGGGTRINLLGNQGTEAKGSLVQVREYELKPIHTEPSALQLTTPASLAISQTFTCDVSGCKQTSEHTHEICSDSNCTETGTHAHGNDWYYGHYDSDGHGYNENHNKTDDNSCIIAGCTRSGNHSHDNASRHKENHRGGHH